MATYSTARHIFCFVIVLPGAYITWCYSKKMENVAVDLPPFDFVLFVCWRTYRTQFKLGTNCLMFLRRTQYSSRALLLEVVGQMCTGSKWNVVWRWRHFVLPLRLLSSKQPRNRGKFSPTFPVIVTSVIIMELVALSTNMHIAIPQATSWAPDAWARFALQCSHCSSLS